MQRRKLLIHTVCGKCAIIAAVGQGCVSVPSVGSPEGGLSAKPSSPALRLALGIGLICKSSQLFKTAQLSGIAPLSFPRDSHGRAASNQKCQRGTSLRTRCARVGALQAVSSVSSATMLQLVGKLLFTHCRCAASQDGPQAYEELFAKLDANKDGKVDVAELRAGLAAMGIKSGKGAAQVGSRKEAAGLKAPCLHQILGRRAFLKGKTRLSACFHFIGTPLKSLNQSLCINLLSDENRMCVKAPRCADAQDK